MDYKGGVIAVLGYDVPGDKMIVGLDNVQSHLMMPRRITSITTDKPLFAGAAAKIIMDKTQGNNSKTQKEIIKNIKLVIGKTTVIEK